MTPYERPDAPVAVAPSPSAPAAPPPELVDDPLRRRTRAFLLLLPLLALVAAYLLARTVAGAGEANQMAAAALASFLGLGTTIIFGSAVLGDASFIHLTTLQLALVVLVLNTALCLVFLGSFDLLERVPWLGPKLTRARSSARAVVGAQPWIRRWATAGVALFVISPLPGSGSLGGTLVGRIIGLSRLRTFVSVATANALVCGAYALGADAIERLLRRSQMSTMERLGLLVATAILLVMLMRWIVARSRLPSPTKSE